MSISLSGKTQIFPIVGDPVAQVKAPTFLSQNLQRRGIDAAVIPAHVNVAQFADFMTGMMAMQNVHGIIATVPHKIAMLDFCQQLDDRAEIAGSVNVMRRCPDGGWYGANTDGMGYLRGIQAKGFDVTDKRILLIGAGGAGSAIAYEFLLRRAAHLVICDIDTTRRDLLIGALNARFPMQITAGSTDPRGFDLIGNATPLGMQVDDPMPFETDQLRARQFVSDVVTAPDLSPLISVARHCGCATLTGREMFDAQEDLLVDFLIGADWK